jgi:HAD superfamily hydrolase (TIGR01509 family)
MTRYDAILFDFDGVLLDSEPVHCAAWAEILKPFFYQLTWDYYLKHCVGFHDTQVIQTLAATCPQLPVQALRSLYPAKRDLFLQKIQDAPPFAPDLIPLLRSLDRYKLAVVTSSARSEVEPVLIAGNLRQFFQILVCGDDPVTPKPAPDPYLLAARLLQANQPLVVEDTDMGVASAQAAGFDVVRVTDAHQMPGLLRAKLAAQY